MVYLPCTENLTTRKRKMEIKIKNQEKLRTIKRRIKILEIIGEKLGEDVIKKKREKVFQRFAFPFLGFCLRMFRDLRISKSEDLEI